MKILELRPVLRPLGWIPTNVPDFIAVRRFSDGFSCCQSRGWHGYSPKPQMRGPDHPVNYCIKNPTYRVFVVFKLQCFDLGHSNNPLGLTYKRDKNLFYTELYHFKQYSTENSNVEYSLALSLNRLQKRSLAWPLSLAALKASSPYDN